MATTKKRKARESTKPEGETQEQKFVRLANARVSAVIKRLRLVRNLAGPSYKFTEEQVEKISTVLNDELVATLKAFAARLSTASGEETKEIFSL
jgi:hypothetical protein